MPFFSKKPKDKNEKQPAPACYPRQVAPASVPFQPQPYPPYPGGQPYPPQAAPPPYTAVGAPYQQPSYPTVPQAILIQGGYDAGARFDAKNPPNIPPPPPGCGYHPAQAAAASGYQVQMTQQKSDFFAGGSDGGFSTGF